MEATKLKENDYPVVDLENLITYSEDIKIFNDCLERRGWCFLKCNTPDFNVDDLFLKFKDFINSPKEFKEEYCHLPRYGYVKTENKEAFRMLTGNLAETMKIPEEMNTTMLRICKWFDNTAKKIIDTCESVFGNCQKVDYITLLPKSKTEGFGMLDLVNYSNKSEIQSEEKGVAAHGDPGLFAISLKSSCPGLQMFDPENEKWISVPPDYSVLWCGDTADEITNGRIKIGWHRVENEANEQRQTVWYEVCVKDQIPKKFLQDGFSTNDNTVSPIIEEADITVNVKTLTGKTIPITINPNCKVEDLKMKIQDKEGIPPDKLRLLCKVSLKDDSKSLKDYNITDGSTIYIVLRFRDA